MAEFFFETIGYARYRFKDEFATERQLVDYFASLDNGVWPEAPVDVAHLRATLLQLVKNVVLLASEERPHEHFYPRINLDKTSSFQELDHHHKYVIWELYLDYYYRRQEHLWGEKGAPVHTGSFVSSKHH